MSAVTAEQFVEATPSPVNSLRGVVLFGRNVASYKFALAKSLLELSRSGTELVTLDELAVPFARHLCDHLRDAPRQGTSASSKFLDACRSFNDGAMDQDQLWAATARLGFVNVIDAFHVVGSGEVPTRFFVDDRAASNGIRLTDDLLGLDDVTVAQTLAETEARWRLVETAWDLEISRSVIAYDDHTGLLVPSGRRRSVTSARDALNGYQKGRCFYCYRPVGTTPLAADLADVDHLFPHKLQALGVLGGLDGIWNLVLACWDCNRGPGGKFDAVPDLAYVERLRTRNEYLISSHHPLRETLRLQTGTSSAERHAHLQQALTRALEVQPTRWTTPALADPTF